MRKIKLSLVVLLVAALSLCNSSFLFAKNAYADSIILPLIANESFETTGDWQVNAIDNSLDENKLSFVSENAYDGEKYYQLREDEYSVKTNDYIEIDGGDNYIFGIKYIASSLDNSCQINLEAFDEDNNYLSTVVGKVNTPNLIDAWSDAQVYFNTNENVAKVKMEIKINALEGSVGIDYAYANKDVIKINFGASITLQKDKTEIRFTGQIDKEAYDYYLDKSVSVGIMFIPTKAFNSVGEFTFNGVNSQTWLAGVAEKWKNQETIDSDGYYEFACAMQNMHVKEALTISISARAFVKFTIDGKERYIYSSFDLESNSRSIQSVALNLKADTENYVKYDDFQRTIIDAYANGELPKFTN